MKFAFITVVCAGTANAQTTLQDVMKWTKAPYGESCSSQCTALGRTCNAAAEERQNAVTTANMPDVNTALKTGGLAAGFACTAYDRPVAATRRSSAATASATANSLRLLHLRRDVRSTYQRLCCCLDPSDAAASTVCATSAADCDASTWWDATNKLCVPTAAGCPAGWWHDSSAASTCVPCPSGTFGPLSGQTSELAACTGRSAASASTRHPHRRRHRAQPPPAPPARRGAPPPPRAPRTASARRSSAGCSRRWASTATRPARTICARGRRRAKPRG